MTPRTLLRPLALALALAAGSGAAFADGDIYSRLMEMREMDRNKDGMVSKEEFLAMIAKAWDMHAQENKLRDGKLNAEQVKSLEKLLGRTLSAQASL
ncbi:hypothetical protein [Piscinibacter defluvii]|uniref:hypothetical protein n=1 Tax=Piscinibacter defluvii TaxID=1796922 RepID=UPI0013E32AC8|nr:hypothetical protein [Piscinibacter defluvii]